MKKLLETIQNLSLDVTAGAIICSAFIAELLQVGLQLSMLLGLGIAIWLIYTIDHLFDAHKSGVNTTNARHKFHKKHFKSIMSVAVIIFIAGLYNVFSLPWLTVKLGLVLAILVAIYIASLHLLDLKKTGHKEFLAALIYSFGVFTAPLSLLDRIDTLAIIIFATFFLIVMANLLLFPLFEEESDRQDELQSVVTLYGKTTVRRLCTTTISLCMVAIVFLSTLKDGKSWLMVCALFFLMAMVLTSMLIWPKFFKQSNRYRFAGDGIFLLPIIYLLF